MSDELVSVLFPAHKDQEFLEEALISVIEQTYKNIEILFLDNSEFGLSELIWNRSCRVRYIRVPKEFGLSQTLNVGISESRGTFLMRMDYDDICLPGKVSIQVEFMRENKEVGICGTFAEVIGENLNSRLQPGLIVERPVYSELMSSYLLYKNPLIHPTVMMRKSTIEMYGLRYRKEFDSAEDLDFWSRSVRHFKIANIPVPLLKYRVHKSQYTRLDDTNSQLRSSIIHRNYAIWVIVHIRNLRLPALKVIIKRTLKILRLKTSRNLRSNFKKFD